MANLFMLLFFAAAIGLIALACFGLILAYVAMVDGKDAAIEIIREEF
jgi:hypothetical protein